MAIGTIVKGPGVSRIIPQIREVGSSLKGQLMSKQSIADELEALSGNSELTYQLLPGTHIGVHDSAIAYSVNARNAGITELQPFHVALDRAVGTSGLGRYWNTKEKQLLREAYSRQVYEYLQKAYRNELEGIEPPPLPADPKVRGLVEVYQNSGFAEKSLKRQKDAGIEGAQDVQYSKNYVNVVHSPHKILRFINGDEGKRVEVAKLYGSQLLEQFPRLAKTVGREGESTDKIAARVGEQFIQTLEESLKGVRGSIEGTTKEYLALVLKNSGADDTTIQAVLRNITPDMTRAGESKNLRARVNWDMERAAIMPDGSTFRVLDGVNTNMEQILTQYNNTNSARVGLAKKGFTSTDKLTTEFNKILDKYKGDEKAYKQAKDFLDNTKDLLLGRGVGDPDSEIIQGLTILARAMHLANSGIYNTIETQRIIQNHGFRQVMTHFGRGWQAAISKESITPEVAQSIIDVVQGRLVNEGRLRAMVTHLENGYQATHQNWMNQAHVLGQSVQYLNGSEYVRRIQIGIITGIQGDYLTKLARGDQGAKEYFQKIGMTEERINQLRSAIDTHGLNDSLWDVSLADEVATRLLSDVDTMALMARKGEAPAFLTYSSTGRMLFPYFTFVAASHNKILRAEYNRNGATGVAMQIITVAPLAYMAAAMSNVLNNRDINDDIHMRALSIIPTLGYFNVPVSFGQRGEVGGTPTVFAPINAIPKFIKAAEDGNVDRMVQNSPILNVALPVRLAVSAVSENR